MQDRILFLFFVAVVGGSLLLGIIMSIFGFI